MSESVGKQEWIDGWRMRDGKGEMKGWMERWKEGGRKEGTDGEMEGGREGEREENGVGLYRLLNEQKKC